MTGVKYCSVVVLSSRAALRGMTQKRREVPTWPGSRSVSEALGVLPGHPWGGILHKAMKNSKIEGLSNYSSSIPHMSWVRQLIQVRCL